MLKVKIEPTREEIKSQGGILPAGRLLNRFGFKHLDGLDKSTTTAGAGSAIESG